MLLDQASAGSPKGSSAAPAGACTRDRQERELARFRLHLVKHKSALKNRVHSTLINFAKALPGHRPLESRAESCSHGSRSRSPGAPTSHHPYIPLLMSATGSAGVLAFTIARRDRRGRKAGYTGLCPLTSTAPLPALGAARGDDARAQAPRLCDALQRSKRRLGKQRAGPKSRRSTSPAGSPKRSGTCFLTTNFA
jgi:hypothetical protein